MLPNQSVDYHSRLRDAIYAGIICAFLLTSVDQNAKAETTYIAKNKDGVSQIIKAPPKSFQCKSHCLIYDENTWRCAKTNEKSNDPMGRPKVCNR